MSYGMGSGGRHYRVCVIYVCGLWGLEGVCGGWVCVLWCVRARAHACVRVCVCCVLGSILQKEADFAVGRGGGKERAK